jgi:hypothetical protein
MYKPLVNDALINNKNNYMNLKIINNWKVSDISAYQLEQSIGKARRLRIKYIKHE